MHDQPQAPFVAPGAVPDRAFLRYPAGHLRPLPAYFCACGYGIRTHRGIGKETGKGKRRWTGAADMAEDVVRLLDHLKIERQ